MMIQLECDDDKVIDVLEATKGLVRNTKLFSQQALPKLPSSEKTFEDRAQAIAQRIRPRPNQPMRQEAIRAVLGGHDTFWNQIGEPDPALRNATGALSKALRKFAPYEDSPLEILCERRREVFADGPMKGRYQGTHYLPNRLGKRVREILKELNAY